MPGFLNVLLANGPAFVGSGIAINDSDSALVPAVAQATNQVLTDGTVREGGVDVGNILLQGNAADVEIFVETVSGVVDSGTVDAWVALSGNPSWTRVRNTGVGVNSYVGTYKLRDSNTGVEFFTGGTFALTAEQFI